MLLGNFFITGHSNSGVSIIHHFSRKSNGCCVPILVTCAAEPETQPVGADMQSSILDEVIT
jgi:hypothetical protein